MIIKVSQVKSNLEYEFDIKIDDLLYCRANNSRLSSGFTSSVKTTEGDLKYQSDFKLEKVLKKHIPYMKLFGNGERQHVEIFDNDDELFCSISSVRSEKYGQFYEILSGNGVVEVYARTTGMFEYFLVRSENEDVAMIRKSMKVVNNLDKYEIFLLDEFENYKDFLILFCLYWDNFNASRRNRIEVGSMSIKKGYSYSKSNSLFKDGWLHDNFGLDIVEFAKVDQKMSKWAPVSTAIFYLLVVGIIIMYLLGVF